MATLYVTEFSSMPANGAQVMPRPAITTQTVAIGGTSTPSSAFGAQTRYIRVHTDATCSTAISANPTATTSSERLPADATEYFAVQPGDKIAVISNS